MKLIILFFQKSVDDFQSSALSRYLDPMRPYRCTLCVESFDSELQFQLHVLSQSHQDRSRPDLQKALLALQGLNSGMPTLDLLNRLNANCPDSEQDPDIGFPSSNLETGLLERLMASQAMERGNLPGNVPGIPPSMSAQILLQQMESQNRANSSPTRSPNCDRKRSSSNNTSRRQSEESPVTLITPEFLNESGIPSKIAKNLFKSRFGSGIGSSDEIEIIRTQSEDGSVTNISNNSNEMDQFSDDDSNGLKIVEADDDLQNQPTNRYENSNDGTNESNRRMRTLISPDQAEVLYREYLEVMKHSEVGEIICTLLGYTTS